MWFFEFLLEINLTIVVALTTDTTGVWTHPECGCQQCGGFARGRSYLQHTQGCRAEEGSH